MPIFQQGAFNTTALTVPGVYVQIIPPQQIINGVPTNIAGVVGTSNWGPLNTPTLVSNLSDFVGTVVNRANDLGTYIAVASQQGRAGVYAAVRVSDNSDTASTATIQGSADLQASGTITFAVNPTNNSTITIGTTVVTFVTAGPTGNQVLIAGTLAATLALLLTFLQFSTDAQLTQCLYAVSPTVLTITFRTFGTSGNTFALAASVATPSGATLTGGSFGSNGLFLIAKYTGSLGNTLTWAITSGTVAGTFALIVSLPGVRTERIDNVAGSGNTFWLNLASAVNNGNGFSVPPSQLVVAIGGTISTAPAITTTPGTFAGGTDGVAQVTTARLLGNDGAVRTGMYALRGYGTSCFTLCDCTDTTSFATQLAFGANEATEGFVSTPSGDTPTNAVLTRNTLGLDNFDLHIMLGDFLYWFDSNNNLPRFVNPCAAMIGLRANLAPHLDTLNKPIFGITGTQRTQTNTQPYSDADIQTLSVGRVDVIAQPPQYALQKSFTPRLGQTSASDEITRNDSYTQMINYIARTFAAALFTFIGQNQGFLDPDATRNGAKIAIDGFLQNLVDAGMIQAFSSKLDASINPPNRVNLGYMHAQVIVEFFGVVRYFLIDLQGGVTVLVNQANQNFQAITAPVQGLSTFPAGAAAI